MSSLSEARSLGQSHYVSETVCCRGHRAMRRVSDKSCMECVRERNRGTYTEKPTEQRDARNARKKQHRVSMTPEQRAARVEYQRRQKARMTPEQRLLEAEYQRQRRANFTPEQRARNAEGRLRWKASLSEDKRKEYQTQDVLRAYLGDLANNPEIYKQKLEQLELLRALRELTKALKETKEVK